MSAQKRYRDDECHKCGGLLDTTGWPPWCKACRAAHKRAYRQTHPAYVERAQEYKDALPAEQRARYAAAVAEKAKAHRAEQRAAWEASRRERGLLTYPEIAASLGLSSETLRHQVINGALHPATREHGRPLFAVEEVERYRRESKGQYGWVRPDHPLYDTETRVAYVTERHAVAKERRQA